MRNNILVFTDSYKFSHYKQYPPKTQTVYSYFESRGGRFDETVFFGLQYYLKEYLQGQVVNRSKIEYAKKLVDAHVGPGIFNEDGWNYIIKKHGGRLPVSIKAVPEGTVVPNHNVLMTIENTDPECYWLTNYLETLLVQVWYGCTVATQSRAIKKNILEYLEKTGDPSLINFKLHDFGFRGVSSVESAAMGGAAHLVNFMGTDTVASIILAQDFYKADMPGYSIPAAEHSTICSWGKENEVDAMRNMLQQYPTGLVACVSDSFNIFEACEKIWGEQLKAEVIAREGCLVVRPDSGYPAEVVVRVLEILGSKFGYETNAKGFKVLNPKVRVIQGDGVNIDSIDEILANMKYKGWSADNVAFGMGGALLQQLNRDTQKFAFKCASVTIDGEERDVYKDPITDPGKVSKAGRMKLIRVGNEPFGELKTLSPSITSEEDVLVEVFRDGKVLKEYTFDEVRKNVEAQNKLEEVPF